MGEEHLVSTVRACVSSSVMFSVNKQIVARRNIYVCNMKLHHVELCYGSQSL